MKMKKYLTMLLLAFTTSGAFISCEDDETLGEAPRLFRPIVTCESQNNNLICTWDNISGATSYELVLYKATGEQTEEGAEIMEQYQTVTVETSPFTFENLTWDEKYAVRIKALGAGKTSEFYDGTLISISYPTKLQKVNAIIENAAKLEWNAGVTITTVEVYVQSEENGTYTLLKTEAVTETDNAKLEHVVEGLNPETKYRLIAYSGEEGELSYEGRMDFTTTAPVNYGDNVVDLRSLTDEESEIILDQTFFDSVPDGAVVVLKAGFTYKVQSKPTFKTSFRMTTGASLSGNATLLVAEFKVPTDVLGPITFEKVNIYGSGDKNASNFGNTYFFNLNQAGTLEALNFIDCEVKYMRGIARLRNTMTINNVKFENCIIDSVADYAVLSTENSTAVKNVEITNSTIANVKKFLVNTKSSVGFANATITISNCTFAYCGAEQYLFEFNNKANYNVGLKCNVSDCLFGPQYVGSKFAYGARCSGENSVIAFSNCYKTKDLVSTSADGATSAPLEVDEYAGKSTDLWKDPLNGDFTIKDIQSAAATVGDPRWHVN